MINLLVTSTIMRSKFKINYSNLVSCTCGSFLALIIRHLCIKTLDLMIALAANKLIIRSKFPINALFWISISWWICKSQIRSWDWILKSIIRQFWPPDRSVNLLIDIIGQIQPHEQTQFWPHDQKFNLLKSWISISWNLTSWPWVSESTRKCPQPISNLFYSQVKVLK